MDVPAGVTQEEGNTGFSIHLRQLYIIHKIHIYIKKAISPIVSVCLLKCLYLRNPALSCKTV